MSRFVILAYNGLNFIYFDVKKIGLKSDGRQENCDSWRANRKRGEEGGGHRCVFVSNALIFLCSVLSHVA